MRIPRDYRLPRTEDMLLSYAKEHGIPVSNLVNEAQTIAEEGLAILGSGSVTNQEEKASLMRYCKILIGFMGYTKDSSALPYLETKSFSEDDEIRQLASYGIISIMGKDSVGFLEKAKRGGVHTQRDLYQLYESFGRDVQREREVNPSIPLDDANGFLLEVLEKEKASGTAKMLDLILCETLDGYAVSIQREQTVERMIRNGPDHSRPHFEGIKSEIERTPREKRIDVRQRLKKSPAEQ